MADELFKIVLKGYGEGKGEYYIEQDFAKLFGIPREKAKVLLSSAPVDIKKNITADEAGRFESAIRKVGALCEIVEMRFDGLSLVE